MGAENRDMLRWLDVNMIIMGPETIPDQGLGVGKYIGTKPGPAVPAATSTKGQVKTTDSYEVAILVDFSGIIWGPAPFVGLTRFSERFDYSYTNQFYTRLGFGGMRLDDSKVVVILYKK